MVNDLAITAATDQHRARINQLLALLRGHHYDGHRPAKVRLTAATELLLVNVMVKEMQQISQQAHTLYRSRRKRVQRVFSSMVSGVAITRLHEILSGLDGSGTALVGQDKDLELSDADSADVQEMATVFQGYLDQSSQAGLHELRSRFLLLRLCEPNEPSGAISLSDSRRRAIHREK